MLRMLSGDDPIEVKTVTLAVYGRHGIGKSTLGFGAAEKVVVMAFDKGVYRAINRRPETTTVLVDTWADVRELVKSHPDRLREAGCLVVDTVGRCLELLAVDVIAENYKHGQPDGNLTQQGWGALKTRWKAFVSKLQSLGVSLVLIAHEKEKDKNGETVYRPDIQGGSLSEVCKDADAIAYIHTAGNQPVLDFNLSDTWEAKCPARWQPFPIPDPSSEPLFLHTIIEQLKDHINRQAKAGAEATKGAQEWREKIRGLEGVEDLNGLLGAIQALSEPLRAQVKALVRDHAKEKGWEWDPKGKAFTAGGEVFV